MSLSGNSSRTRRGATVLLAVLGAFLCTVIAACGSSSSGGGDSTSTAASSGDTASGIPSEITVVQQPEVVSLAPDIISAVADQRAYSEFLQPLTNYEWDGKTYELVGVLAESWEQVDAQTWTFKLRSGVKFSNGEPFTAEAVKFTYDTWKKNNGEGAQNLANFTAIRVVDDLTVEVDTAAVDDQSLPAQMSMLWIYPPKYYEEVGKVGFGKAPVGTGPYKVDSWQEGGDLVLSANENYWGPKPAVQKITLRTVAEPSSRMAMLQTGEADLISDMPANFASQIEGVEDAKVVEQASTRRVFLLLDAHDAPTDDVRVRQAINYAIDRKALVEQVLQGHAYNINGIYIPGDMGYDSSFQGYSYDPDRAKQLLTDAGHPDGVEIELNYATDSSVAQAELAAQAVEQQLAKAGIKAKLTASTSSALQPKLATGDAHGMNLWSFGPLYFDDNYLANLYFTAKSRYGIYGADEKLDELAKTAATTKSVDERRSLYQDIEKYVIMDTALWAPLYSQQDVYGVNKALPWTAQPNQRFALGRVEATQ